MNIEDITFIFADIETTGLSPQNCRICELAAVKSVNGRRAGIFSKLINPRVKMPPEAQAVHQITDDMLKDKPVFADIAREFVDFIDGGILVFHNADFDVPFLVNELSQAGLRLPPGFILDTLKLARLYCNFASNRLGAIARDIGCNNDGWHRAQGDAQMTEKVFYHLLGKLKEKGARTLDDLIRAHNNKHFTGEKV